MSEYHRARAVQTGPDLSGIRSEIRGLQSTNTRLTHDLNRSRREYSSLHGDVRGLSNSVDACRSDNQRLARSLGQTQNAVSQLEVGQHQLREHQRHLESGLNQANRSIGELRHSHQAMSRELGNVQAEQDRHAQHLQGIDRDISALGQGQQQLRSDLERQRQETQRELKCMEDYQHHLHGEINGCQESIEDLNQVTADLQTQQNLTVEMVKEVNQYTTEVHEELRTFEGVVEERHRQAQEDLQRQRLSVAAARQLAENNLALIDRREATRYGMAADLTEVDNLLGQANGLAVDDAMQNTALTLLVSASEKCLNIRQKTQQVANEQLQREQRIRERLSSANAILENWRTDEHVSFYANQTLDSLHDEGESLRNGVTDLDGISGYRDLTEQTVKLETRAEQLREEVQQCDAQRFPEIVSKSEQRNRFIDAIYQGIQDTFARSGQQAEYKVPPQLADPNDVNSPIRFSAGAGTRTVIVEIDLEGNCHFWWEGYPEKSHIHDVEEFESLLKSGKKLGYQLNSPRTFNDNPEYPEPPPNMFLAPRPHKPAGGSRHPKPTAETKRPGSTRRTESER